MGMLFEWPFEIGDKVYCIDERLDYVIEQKCCGYSESPWQGSFNKGKDHRFLISHNSYNLPIAWQLKDVFGSNVEAERALEERRNLKTE